MKGISGGAPPAAPLAQSHPVLRHCSETSATWSWRTAIPTAVSAVCKRRPESGTPGGNACGDGRETAPSAIPAPLQDIAPITTRNHRATARKAKLHCSLLITQTIPCRSVSFLQQYYITFVAAEHGGTDQA